MQDHLNSVKKQFRLKANIKNTTTKWNFNMDKNKAQHSFGVYLNIYSDYSFDRVPGSFDTYIYLVC